MKVLALAASLQLVACNRDREQPVDHVPDPGSTPMPPEDTDPPVEDPGEIAIGVMSEGTREFCEWRPDRARDVIVERCGSCHGDGQPITAESLVDSGWVVPGMPAMSLLYDAIVDDAMPLGSGGGPLTAPEKEAVEEWILCGAEPWNDGPTRGFLSAEMEIQAARDDLVTLSFDDQPNARYLSLVPLYNAGISADRIALYATGVAKLLASSTAASNPRPMAPVGLDGTDLPDGSTITVGDGLGESLLFRLDLRELEWDEGADVWEELVRQYPYAIPLSDALSSAEDLQAGTHTRVPLVRGDWFVAHASLPPLYYDILEVPQTLDAFFLRFGGFDRDAQFEVSDAECAGIDAMVSLVSGFNRGFCRYDAIDGYCWESFDFGSNMGPQDLFANPTAFRDASDGGEAFCALDSGMQVYFVRDATGQRIDAAPVNLVTDFDGLPISAGRSCMGCHDGGVQLLVDQVLPTVLGAPANYTDEVLDQVFDWYPDNVELLAILTDDGDHFQAGLDDVGVLPGEEPVVATADEHEIALTADRVAAELGLPAATLADTLAANVAIQALYAPLLVPGGTITREMLDGAFRDTICALELGDACDPGAFCGLSAVPCDDGETCDPQGRCVP